MLTKQDLNLIRGVVKGEVQSGLVPVRKDIGDLKKDVKKLRKDLTKTIDFFDKSNTSTREQVNKIRTEIGLKEVEFAY